MTPERWQQVKDIFDRAAESGPASRIAFIREHCGDDEELRKEVESLLASDLETGSLLDNPFIETVIDASAASNSAVSLLAQDDSFGPYVPVRVLGEGGMGTVYLAQQQLPIRRDVALKVVKLGMDSRQVLERFESERQVLALMEYPNVARVLDAGTSERGRPYFVMEYVDGVPITHYCDGKALNTHQRLQLFVPVCNALQHAHKKGIIHRDVKPSNILVTEVDGKPVPKVIDFGVARATDQRAARREEFTFAGQIVGTPEYMSPEQADTDSRDIDTGTDVYSLGVVLYELLVGALPLDVTALRRLAFGEVLRAIRETPIPKPTARITQMGAAAEGLALQRSTNPGQLKRDLAGDLDCIVMKAIDKDRHYRYVSASEFATDIEKYLRSEPVLAAPPGAAYRVRKFVVRHKRPVAAAAAIVLALVAGIITTTWQARLAGQQRAVAIAEKAAAQGQRILAEQHAAEAAMQRDAAQAASVRAATAEGRARRERNAALTEKRRADNEAATAMAVNDFLQNDLLAQASAYSQAGPDAKPEPDLKVRTALDRAAARIAGKFDGQPMVEISIRMTISSTYRRLGQYPEAQREMQRARDLSRRVLGEEHPKTLEAMTDLGLLYERQGKYAQAESLLTKSVELSRRVLGEEHLNTLAAMNTLGLLYQRQGKYAQSEPFLTKSLELSRRMLGEQDPTTVEAMNTLGMLYRSQAKYAHAEPLFVRILGIIRSARGEDHPDTLAVIGNLGALYELEGKYAQSEPLLTKSLELSRRVLGEEHPNTLVSMSLLGDLYQRQGKFAQAEPLLAKDLELSRRVLGEEHPDTLAAIDSLGALYERQGKYAQAEPLLAKSLELRRRVHSEEYPSALAAMNTLVEVYQRQAKYAQAEPLLAKILEVRRRLLSDEHPDTLAAMNALVQVYQRQGKYAQAESLLAKSLEVRRRAQGEANAKTMTGTNNGEANAKTIPGTNNLERLHRGQGKTAPTDPLLARELEARQRVRGEEQLATANAQWTLADLRLQQQNYAGAERLLREAANYYDRSPDDWGRYRIQSLLGESLVGQGRYAEAEPLLLSGYQGMIESQATRPADSHAAIEQAEKRIVKLYQDWGKSDLAHDWRAKVDAQNAAAAQKQ